MTKLTNRDEFEEMIKSMLNKYTSAYALNVLIWVVGDTCSLTDLERILEVCKNGSVGEI